MTFRKTACLAAMLMCCSQTAFAAAGATWDEHLNAWKSADGTTVTSSGFSEVFAAGGTQKAEEYKDIYIGHVLVGASDTFSSAVVSNNKGVMGSGLNAYSVYGGCSEAYKGKACDSEVKGNGIVLKSGSNATFVYGGYADYGSNSSGESECVVSGNYVTAEDGATATVIHGGHATSSMQYVTLSAVDNTVTATGATVRCVWGGYTDSLKSYASNNTVILNNVTAEDGDAGGNRPSIVGGIADGVKGWSSLTSDFSAEHIASNNSIIINKSKIGIQVVGSGVIGAYSGYQVATDTVSSSGNTVTMADTDFSGAFICGANVVMPYAYENTSISVTANDNKIVLYGGNYSLKDSSQSHAGALDGGIAIYAAYISGETGNYNCIEANNNSIELRPGSDGAAPVFSDSTYIFGGYARYTNADGKTTAGTTTGNSLNFYDVKGMKAGNISDFQVLNYEYKEMRAGDVIFELAGAGLTESLTVLPDAKQPTSIANAAVSVRVANLMGSDGGDFKEGDTVVLFKNANGVDTEGVKLTLNAPKGATVSYEAAIETSADKTEILLKGKGMKVNPGTKAITEGTASGIALAGTAANTTIDLLRDFSFRAGAITPFVHVQGSSMRYETGSSVNVSTVSLVAGAGYAFETGAGKLGFGAFFEYGKGSYTTSNSFDSRSDVNGDGNSWYMGGGILAKMDFLQTGPGHFYVEGSAHMGTLHNEYDSNDLTDFYGNSASFDMDSPYYSLHGGLGYVWNMGCGHDLDIYGKYIWTRVQGTDDTLTTGDQYEFDDMDSNRVRLGVRYTYNGSERFSPYIGAAFEHEFSGSCDSRVYGHSVAAPSFEGSSGIGELGIMMRPSDEVPLSINLGVQGYVGKKQGVSGNCLMMYEF